MIWPAGDPLECIGGDDVSAQDRRGNPAAITLIAGLAFSLQSCWVRSTPQAYGPSSNGGTPDAQRPKRAVRCLCFCADRWSTQLWTCSGETRPTDKTPAKVGAHKVRWRTTSQEAANGPTASCRRCVANRTDIGSSVGRSVGRWVGGSVARPAVDGGSAHKRERRRRNLGKVRGSRVCVRASVCCRKGTRCRSWRC